MSLIEIIGISTNIIWAITLLAIIRTVRLRNGAFVENAVEGNFWLGKGTIGFSWFVILYKKYIEIRGINVLLILNLASLAIAIISVCLFIYNEFK